MAIDLYHNPHCATSRKALALLRQHGIEPNIIEYLKMPPDRARLRALLAMMGMRPGQLLRKREKAAMAKAGIDPRTSKEDAILEAMLAEPILIERPIVVNGRKAVLGRPPGRVLEIL